MGLLDGVSLEDSDTESTFTIVAEVIACYALDGEKLLTICRRPNVLEQLVSCLDGDSPVAIGACKALVNISADDEARATLLPLDENESRQDAYNLFPRLYKAVLDPNLQWADGACMILSNLTHCRFWICHIATKLMESVTGIDRLVYAFCSVSYNKKGCTLEYLASLFCNLTQLSSMRQYILDKKKCLIQMLVPFIEYAKTPIQRTGIIGLVRNCCFDTEYHMQLLSDEVSILSRILMPLTGGEEFPDYETEKLPLELQYLPSSKTREADPNVRIMLLETLLQLCATRSGREYLREHNAYIILRELHHWEQDEDARYACENVVDVLIRTEDEIGEDNLKLLTIPPDLQEQFLKLHV